jgi:RNA polymerase sigma-70 factor (ECF subfamily)
MALPEFPRESHPLALALVKADGTASVPDWRDPAWTDGLRAGNERVLDVLMQELAPALCAYARRYVASAEDAEELVHDVFVALWMNRSRIVIRDSIRTYLYRAVTNRGINAVRDRATERRVLGWVERAAHPHGATELHEGELATQRSQLAVAVQEAMARLPERVRTAFDLVRMRGLSYGEAAAVMGVAPKTIDTHLSRAVKSLRESLRGVWP